MIKKETMTPPTKEAVKHALDDLGVLAAMERLREHAKDTKFDDWATLDIVADFIDGHRKLSTPPPAVDLEILDWFNWRIRHDEEVGNEKTNRIIASIRHLLQARGE